MPLWLVLLGIVFGMAVCTAGIVLMVIGLITLLDHARNEEG